MSQKALEELFIRVESIFLATVLSKNLKELIKHTEEDCEALSKFYDCNKYEALLIAVMIRLCTKKRMITNGVLRKCLKMDWNEMAEMVIALRKLKKISLIYTKHSNKYGVIYHVTEHLLQLTFTKNSLNRLTIIENAEHAFVKKCQNELVRKFKLSKQANDLFLGISTTELIEITKKRHADKATNKLTLFHKN